MSYQILIFHLILMLVFTGCASGQNPYFNNKNTLGLLGGAGGAAGGHLLCKNCKGVAKVAAIGGGALLGLLAGSRVGEYFDKKDQDRQVKLIEDVLANNQDNQISTTQYQKSFRNPNTGQTQNGIISQSAVPLRTYQQNNKPNIYLQNDMPNRYARNYGVCRDLEINFSVSVDNAPPTKQQYYSYCKTEQGWKQVN
jgi:hypothetical protein